MPMFLQVVDPFKASYAVKNPIFALILLARESMRVEIGKLLLDETLQERERMNKAIVVNFLPITIV